MRILQSVLEAVLRARAQEFLGQETSPCSTGERSCAQQIILETQSMYEKTTQTLKVLYALL